MIPEGRHGPHDTIPVGVAEGYRRWAPHYADDTAISALENRLVTTITPPLGGLALLDAGCGTGRRLRACGAAEAVGVDRSPEMLDAGIGRGAIAPGMRTMLGDVRALPLPDAAFDVVWCRLVIGHVPDCRAVYAELARVAKPGATIIVTDFHPDAAVAGHTRSFRDGAHVLEVEHYIHTLGDHRDAAGAAGLDWAAARDAAIGPEARPFYERAGRLALYDEHAGLPVVLGLVLRRGR